MHSLVDYCICPDQGWTHNFGLSGQCYNPLSYPARLNVVFGLGPAAWFQVYFFPPCQQFLPSSHEQDTGITDVSRTTLMHPETGLIAFTVRELGTGGLSSANTVALYTSIHISLLKTKHLFFWTTKSRSTCNNVPEVLSTCQANYPSNRCLLLNYLV